MNTTPQMFVRSQSQLALDNPRAKGQRLTRYQVMQAFGSELLNSVLEEGVVALTSSLEEPANTLRMRREALGLDLHQLAKYSSLEEDTVRDAETPGKTIPIYSLNILCQALGLEESILGYRPRSGGDEALGVRLRLMAENLDVKNFSANTVMNLCEAAWVIAKQSILSKAIGAPEYPQITGGDPNYSYPTYEKGYNLAAKTREILGIDPELPIQSVRSLVEETLRVPLIQLSLDAQFAGATIGNGIYRGIVVNEKGRNAEVAVRRMTMCHELAHLLWDPDERLNRIVVDKYDNIEGKENSSDVVEMRANAFAVSFLAPPSAVKKIKNASSSINEAIATVATKFGISIQAAKYHVHNICEVETQKIKITDVDYGEWLAGENLTVDFIPVSGVPISRRGMFAGIVAKAHLDGFISSDSAALFLKCDEREFLGSVNSLVDLWNLHNITSQLD